MPPPLQRRVQRGPSGLGRGFGLGARVVVAAFRLEEDRVFRVTPEVRHRVAAVAAARQHFQATGALAVRARLACGGKWRG